MSIVSEFKLQLPPEVANQIITYAVSNTASLPMVAVALKGKVVFYAENGQMASFVLTK